MTRPNLIINAAIASDADADSATFDTTALDAFTPDFAAQIAALGNDANLTSQALDADPTSVRANEIRWGTPSDGAVLTGSGLNQIGNLTQLQADLQAGIASGAFDTLRLISGGQDIVRLEFTDNALTLRSGNQTVALRGELPTTFQDIFDFINAIGTVLDEGDLRAAARVLDDYDLAGLRLTDGATTLFDASLDNDGVRVAVGGATLRIAGQVPADNLGDIVRLFIEASDIDRTAEGLDRLGQLDDLAISAITLTGADGTVLIRSTGPIDELDPPFGSVIIQGTAGNERNISGDGFDGLAQNVRVALGAGNDSAEIYGDYFRYSDDDTPVTYDGGAGIDTLRVRDFNIPQVKVEFTMGQVSGRDAQDQPLYRVGVVNFEAVEVSTNQRAVVLGDNNDERATPVDVFGRFEFYGGNGTDTLDLTQVRRMNTQERGLSVDELSGFSAIYSGANAIEMSHGALPMTLVLGDVERVQLKDGAGVQSLTLNDVLAQTGGADFTIGTSAADSLSGDLGADVMLGQSGADYLYGDGIQADLTGAVAGQVYRMYQATLDRAPDAEGYEGWVTSLFEGRVALSDFPNGFVNSREFQNTYGALDNAGFVNLLYNNVLGRDADAGGLQGWLDALAGGTSRAGVVLGFSESQEFKNGTAEASAEFALSQSETHWTDDIFRVYRATLDRAPDLVGFTGWAERLGSGTGYQEMVDGFVTSTEFGNTYGSLNDTDFVELLYQNVLGRASDAGGRQGWLDFIEEGGTRAGVVEGFAQSGEFRADTAPDLDAWVRAQGTHDTLVSGPGTDRDVMMGGLLSDVFVFEGNQPARATILDFESWDMLRLTGYDIDTFGAFRAALTQQGDDVVFADGGTEITLADTLIADLTAQQVEF